MGWAQLVSPEPMCNEFAIGLRKKNTFWFCRTEIKPQKSVKRSFIPLENGSNFVLYEKPLFYLNYALEPPKHVSK